MSGRRPSSAAILAERLQQVAAADPPPVPTPSRPAKPPAAERGGAPARGPVERPEGFYAATRAGKKKVTAPLSGEAHRQLKTLAVEQGGTVEGLLVEAINDLFQKHGKPPIA